MGNINYNNFICENYYCQSVSFKPEWLSENSWTIKYKYISNNKQIIEKEYKDEYDNENNIRDETKPYIINKGILKIKNSKKNFLLLSKKLLINFDEIKNIVIPINFKFNLNKTSKISLYIIISSKNLCDIFDKDFLSLSDELFYINLIFSKKKISLSNSFQTDLYKNYIKHNKIYLFNITIENNFNMILINETINGILDKQLLCNFSFIQNTDYYINLFVRTENDLNENEYIELNFE